MFAQQNAFWEKTLTSAVILYLFTFAQNLFFFSYSSRKSAFFDIINGYLYSMTPKAFYKTFFEDVNCRIFFNLKGIRQANIAFQTWFLTRRGEKGETFGIKRFFLSITLIQCIYEREKLIHFSKNNTFPKGALEIEYM